ncbi:MAG: hypothetical protein H0T89_22010 [Deltaproteobacteria bacterium]|nr:hypothetical protein [Deltaproteobacteria bacterium]MDQ3301422.1 hypothetical protein [Myxococcota bacterium]
MKYAIMLPVVRAVGACWLAIVVAGCSRSAAGELRFANEPPVWQVNDRKQLPEIPKERLYWRTLYHVDGFFVRRMTRAMDVKDPVRARDVNALDEVPDSTWFVNRIGVRDMSIEEIKRGANLAPNPFDHRPWQITGGKTGGLSIGFTFKDARGDKYILKFDTPDRPEMETAAHALGHRIIWACGYHVPEDYIGYIRREDLVIKPGTVHKVPGGGEHAMTVEVVDRALAKIHQEPDGRIRVLASRYLPGKPIGPYAREGTRDDDPNDLIAHEHRRTLRGQFPIFSWLNHTDMQEDNTLDAFIADKTDKKRGHVMHYLIDFGKAFGVMGWGIGWKTVGYTYRMDVNYALRSLLTFGLWERPYDDIESPPLRGVGLWEADHYDPGEWRPNSLYWPYEEKDRFDAFWGAKILIRFTREQLAAIVDEAQYSDPRSAQYMLEVLIQRQRKTARYWFDQVAPLDRFAVEAAPDGSARVCFTDLTLHYNLRTVTTRYTGEAFDHTGKALGWTREAQPGPEGRTCVDGLQPPTANDGYTIVKLEVRRNAQVMPPVRVHLARDAKGQLAVIGLRRY